MKKRGKKKSNLRNILIVGIISIIVIGGVLGYYLISRNIEHKWILEIIKPEINNYCQELKNNSFTEMGNCPTCFYTHPYDKDKDYVYENNLSGILSSSLNQGNRYNIEKDGDIYKITVQLLLIFGMRNDYSGDTMLYFNIDKNGQIISKSLEKIECM